MMLLALLFCSTVALTCANPFHKYPFVFLLDVGNEELEKTNTEQLRISIPGGSLALKYPVLDEGDIISHVRVSGIDFGTDLKVNIVGGGPGYKYVMLVFMGKPGVSYDAVVTLQTLPNGIDTDTVNTITIPNPKLGVNDNSYEVSEVNGGDNDDDPEENSNNKKQYGRKTDSEVMQSSSMYYNYADDELTVDDKEEDSQNNSAEEQDDDSFEKDVDEKSSDGENEEDEDDEDIEDKTYNKQMDDEVNDRVVQYTSYSKDSSDSDDKSADIVDDSLYENYQDLKPHFADRYKLYPQSYIYNKQLNVNSVYDKEDPVEIHQTFNDEKIHNDAKYNDNDNSIDSDYIAAEY